MGLSVGLLLGLEVGTPLEGDKPGLLVGLGVGTPMEGVGLSGLLVVFSFLIMAYKHTKISFVRTRG